MIKILWSSAFLVQLRFEFGGTPQRLASNCARASLAEILVGAVVAVSG